MSVRLLMVSSAWSRTRESGSGSGSGGSRSGLISPFSAVRLLLCSSNSSSVPNFCTVASLRVLARATCMGLPNRSKPSTSSAACLADSGLSKTMKAWPFAFRLVLATMSMTLPNSEKSSWRAAFRGSILTRSSRFRT